MPFSQDAVISRIPKVEPLVVENDQSGYITSPVSSRDSFEKFIKDSDKSNHGDYTGDSDEEDMDERENLIPRRVSPVGDEDLAAQERAQQRPRSPTNESRAPKAESVAWSALPRKSQLLILTLARLSEPLCQTGLQAYMFYQLKSFDRTLPDSTIAYQAGLLQAAFTGAQFLTAMIWGRLADWTGMGRKRVILVGLLGTSIGAMGFGFSKTFYTALFWRTVGGALNGNVGVLRTMISEIIVEKKFQSRAFLLLPMTFNVGVIVGPVLGGLLADPVGTYPGIFGKGGSIGGATGVWWMQEWPYALPNIVSACFIAASALCVILGLEETLDSLRGQPDLGLRLGSFLTRVVLRRRSTRAYQPLSTSSNNDIELQPSSSTVSAPTARPTLPFRRIWTRNVLLVLLSHGMMAFHVGTFNQMWFIFLSTTRYVPSSPNRTLHLDATYRPSPPFVFTGGLSLPPPSIGTSLAILGCIGLVLQLALYPTLAFRLGTTRSYRLSLLLFPLAYTLVPFLALVPTASPPPRPADGPAFWAALVAVLSVQVLARTFALPANTILVNNASPHPSVLGTVHGIGQSVSAAMRTLGPVTAAWGYGLGLGRGVVGAVWWGMAAWAVLGVLAGSLVRDGDGHEIWLEGEEMTPAEGGGGGGAKGSKGR